MNKKNPKKRPERSRSLKTRMMAYFLGLLLVIFTLAGVLIITNASSAIIHLNDELTEQVVLARAAEVGKYVDGILHEVGTMAERSTISSGNIASIKSDIESKQSSLRSDFEMLLYAELDGSFYTSLGTEGSIADREYFQEIVNDGQEHAISNPVVSKATGANIFVVAHAVKDSSGKTIGVFAATILTDTFNSVIESIKIGDTGFPWIADNTGLVIAHPDESIRLTLNATGSDQQGFNGLNAVGEKMISGQGGMDEYTNAKGEKFYAVYTPIPSTPNWSFAYSISDADMMAPVNSLLITILIIVSAGLLVVSGFVYLLSNSIVKPVKEAAGLATALASGELDKTVVFKSKDEIGQLGRVLDNEVRAAFKSIEKARIVAKKQAEYQSGEVDKLVVNLDRLSSGELYCDMIVANPDDDTKELFDLFTKISDNLHLTVNTLKTYIEEISVALGAMASGDLSVVIQSDYRGDFVALKDSINSIAGSLSQVMSEINIAAEQVAAGTSQVSDGSQAISQGATEQAGAIEELSATLTQIAAQTKQNAMNANRANELTTAAQTDAANGNDQMKAMQNAMAEINDASENISKIIKVIDDIAFQTNILALNAAVEAARAGVHGKGFAVVAEEVRNLAGRSASAAKETTALIEGSIKKTEAGTRIADETAGALADIVVGVEKAAQLVSEIAAASGEQASGIAQVNQGIEQLSQVVQTNSATSEETAASAEELSSQAEMLKNMVGRFTLQETGEKVRKVQQTPSAQSEKPAAAPGRRIILNDADFGKY